MGFLSRLFGQRSQHQEASSSAEPVYYKDFAIFPESIAENGQFRVAGRITREINGEMREHRFIRSDVLMSRSSADELMVTKAKMFIDQMGEKIFS
ncbi:HlyU family transcriptional regulator [Vibrio mangrovi]|uniref:HlyU family transcriptional regulator n=1 Tax=Vibrio mangrovi TaxID=474394 RepID=A0A1Y6ISW8_9VIBR|nr:HlyU family transcriptional regulator [Vibrio mangrovi]MDW6004471.1 HlyU family transcriptional regulator [Vibrio mangrovi]SMS00759.1 Transcriptional activator HlyU [Vibrio mangrovi]